MVWVLTAHTCTGVYARAPDHLLALLVILPGVLYTKIIELARRQLRAWFCYTILMASTKPGCGEMVTRYTVLAIVETSSSILNCSAESLFNIQLSEDPGDMCAYSSDRHAGLFTFCMRMDVCRCLRWTVYINIEYLRGQPDSGCQHNSGTGGRPDPLSSCKGQLRQTTNSPLIGKTMKEQGRVQKQQRKTNG